MRLRCGEKCDFAGGQVFGGFLRFCHQALGSDFLICFKSCFAEGVWRAF